MKLPKSLIYLHADPQTVIRKRRSELRRDPRLTEADALEQALEIFRCGLIKPRKVFLADQLEMEIFYFRLLAEAELTDEEKSPHLFPAIRELELLVTLTYEIRKRLLWEKAGLITTN